MRFLWLVIFLALFTVPSLAKGLTGKAIDTHDAETATLFTQNPNAALVNEAIKAGYSQQQISEAIQKHNADAGDPRAQLALGDKYQQGDGVPQNYAEALKWYHKAADQGLAAAQFALGGMYAEGEGVPQDFEEAYFLLNLAASKGYFHAYFNDVVEKRDLLAKKLSPQSLAAAQKRASEWKPIPPSRIPAADPIAKP